MSNVMKVGLTRELVPTIHPWVGAELIQGGESGLVFSAKGNYSTAFVEVFIEGTFIRGQGATLVEAEEDAWSKYQNYSKCSNHEWEARSYRNGAGFCKHCNKFKPKAFTPEQLNAYCHSCGIASNYSWSEEDDGETIYACKDHPIRNANPSQLEKLFRDLADDIEEDE